jgi:hypothetical protein
MNGIHPCPDADPLDHWIAADLLFRQEQDEDDEEEDERKEDDDDDDGDENEDGYSE